MIFSQKNSIKSFMKKNVDYFNHIAGIIVSLLKLKQIIINE
jgi:hypothetical protein